MAGLNDLDASTPAGSSTPTQGDDELRAIKAKVKEYAAIEHAYDGKHKFPKYVTLPANDANSRRVVIKDNSGTGKADELYYDNGSSWIKITTNQDVVDMADDLTAHETLADLTQVGGHAAGSVKAATIAASAIVKKHVMGGGDTGSIADVFNGSTNGDNWHTHPLNVPYGSIESVQLYNQWAGNYLCIANEASRSTTSTSLVLLKESRVARSGNYRVRFTLTGDGFTGCQGQIFVNGSARGALQTVVADVPTEFTEDINGLIALDRVQIKALKSMLATAVHVSSFNLYTLEPIDGGALYGY